MSQQRSTAPGAFGVRFRWTPKLVAWLALLVISLILILQNRDPVDISVLFWDFSMRLAWALIATLLVGALLGWAIPRLWAGRRR